MQENLQVRVGRRVQAVLIHEDAHEETLTLDIVPDAAADFEQGLLGESTRLAQTLIGQPKLLVLDEPTSGLDPVSRRDFYALLDGLAADGASILLSSHALTEVEARTDRILILSKGRMVAQGTLSDLRREAALPVMLQVAPREGSEAEVAAALPGATRDGSTLTLACAQGEKLAALARIVGLGDRIADLEVLPPSLEDIYSHFSHRDGQ